MLSLLRSHQRLCNIPSKLQSHSKLCVHRPLRGDTSRAVTPVEYAAAHTLLKVRKRMSPAATSPATAIHSQVASTKDAPQHPAAAQALDSHDAGNGKGWSVRNFRLEGGGDLQQVAELCAGVYDGTDYLPRMIESYAADAHVLILVAEAAPSHDGKACSNSGRGLLGGISERGLVLY